MLPGIIFGVPEAIRSSAFSELFWLKHAFGTRNSAFSQAGMAQVKQVHSATCVTALRPGVAGEADALITRIPNLALSVRTADCFPILLADPRTRSVAAIHAGWRGTAAHIAGQTIARMRDEFGVNAADLHAAIGPGIGACCYEVGEDVARQFGLEGRARVDLARANRDQLIECGVDPAHIDSIARCTFCEPDAFFSYRREGERAGRMISFIRIL